MSRIALDSRLPFLERFHSEFTQHADKNEIDWQVMSKGHADVLHLILDDYMAYYRRITPTMQKLQDELRSSQARRAELWHEIEAKSAALKELREKVAASDKRRAELWTEREQFRMDLAASDKRRAELWHEIEAKTAALKEVRQKLAASDKRRTELWTEREQFRTSLVASDKRRAELWHEIEAKTATLKAVREKLESSEKCGATLRTEVEKQGDALKQLQHEFSVSQAHLQEAKSQIEDGRKKAEELEGRLAAACRATEREKQRAGAKEREVAELKDSTAYRVGMFVTMPARALKRALMGKSSCFLGDTHADGRIVAFCNGCCLK